MTSVTDEVNEEFILAEQNYHDIKEKSSRQLQEIKARVPRQSDVAELYGIRGRLEAAKVRLKNAAMELTRVELENAKGLIVQAVRSEQEQRHANEVEAGIMEMRNRIADAEKNAPIIHELMRERNELHIQVEALKTERAIYETQTSKLEEKRKPVTVLRKQIEDAKNNVSAIVEELCGLQAKLSDLTEQYERTEPERARSIAEHERLEKEFGVLTVQLSKLNDEIFLVTRDKDLRLAEVEKLRKSISEIEDEIQEVKAFPVQISESLDEEAMRTEIRDLDDMCRRLSMEVERIREERFRRRVKI